MPVLLRVLSALALAAAGLAAAVTASAAPQLNCGAAGTAPDGQQLELVVVHGPLSCAEATQVLNDYRADSDKQGSGGFATVGDWQCAHNSVAGYEQTRQLDTCTRGADQVATQAATVG